MWIPLGRPCAVARVAGGREAPCLFGTVKFYVMDKNVLVAAEISGLPGSATNIFAMHIHDGASCQDDSGHYNPDMQPHPHHAGDLPPLFSCGGRAFLVVLTDRFSVREVVGKTLVIHAGPEDFTTQPTGDPGQRIACGVIRCGM